MKKDLVFLFLVLSISAYSKSYYVDSSATGTNDGSSWINAYDSLHKALAVAAYGDTVLVAEGTYKPPTDTDRSAFFQMPSGVVLMGGYPSGGGVRNLTDHRTILSGDIGVEGDPADNTYHVLFLYQTAPSTVLDGLYITGGYADGSGDDGYGGGIYVKTHSSSSYGATIIRCHVYGNHAVTGGGISINQKGDIYFSVIKNNYAEGYGGGLHIKDDGRAYNTDIRNNYAEQGGGGVNIGGFNTAPGLFNCIISNNETAGDGSGILQRESKVVNCDIVNNKGGYGVKQGIYAQIINSVIWGNEPAQFVKGNYATVIDCAIADPSLSDEPGVIVIDSMNTGLNDTARYVRFIAPADSVGNVSTEEGMTHLKQAWWYILPGSACINKGDKSRFPDYPQIDYYGHLRVIMDTIDIGIAEALLNLSTDSVRVLEDKVVLYGNVLFSTDLDMTRRGFEWGTDPVDFENKVENAQTGLDAYSDTLRTLPAPGQYYYRTWGMVGPRFYPGPVKSFFVCSTDTTREYADVCKGERYVFPDSTVEESVMDDMVYYSHLTGLHGCDSVVETNVNVTAVDTSVSVDGIILTANADNAAYQWLDCDNGYATIAGATDKSFTPDSNGYYAVAVTSGNCTDTSACYAVTTVGVLDHPAGAGYAVYPNPAGEQVTFDTGGELFSGHIALWNVVGEKVKELTVRQEQVVEIPLTGLRQGLYFLKITGGQHTVVFRIMKK